MESGGAGAGASGGGGGGGSSVSGGGYPGGGLGPRSVPTPVNVEKRLIGATMYPFFLQCDGVRIPCYCMFWSVVNQYPTSAMTELVWVKSEQRLTVFYSNDDWQKCLTKKECRGVAASYISGSV